MIACQVVIDVFLLLLLLLFRGFAPSDAMIPSSSTSTAQYDVAGVFFSVVFEALDSRSFRRYVVFTVYRVSLSFALLRRVQASKADSSAGCWSTVFDVATTFASLCRGSVCTLDFLCFVDG